MTAGIEITNTSGTTLIDDTYCNLCVSKTGTWSGSTYNLTEPSGSKTPMLAVQFSGNGSVEGFWGKYRMVTASGSSGGKYWIFDQPPSSSSTKAGLLVYDSSGNITFDSGNKYARVRDVISGTFSSGLKTYTYDSGRNYAVCYLNAPRKEEEIWEDTNNSQDPELRWESHYWTTRLLTRVSGRKVYVSSIRTKGGLVIDNGSSPTSDRTVLNEDDWSLAILDVTGY